MATASSIAQKLDSPLGHKAQRGIKHLLELMGEDIAREGIVDTPRRVVKAMLEMAQGNTQDPTHTLGTFFNETSDQMVVVRNIRFTSLCEHHLLPFTGVCTVGYIPHGRVVGLSKIPRLVECLSKRPQVQERLTGQIADIMMSAISPLGVGVIMKAKHSCMGCRGVRQQDAEMVTSALRGIVSHDTTKAELLALM